MIEKYNLDEIFKIAEQIEINGENFYRKAAEKYPDHADFFLKLANEEVAHKKIFNKMREKLNVSDSGQSEVDPEGYIKGYLDSIAKTLVFGTDNSGDILGGCKTIQEIISFAKGREKDTILFYSGVKMVLTDPSEQKVLESLITEEMCHVFWLEEQEAKL